LKQLLTLITRPGHLVNFTKFMIFFKVDEDPELYELLSEAICKSLKRFTVDDLLTILANYSHSLSPSAPEMFRVINEEFCIRLTHEFNPSSLDLVLQPEDLLKITTTLLSYGQMDGTLKNGMIEYIADHLRSLTYEVTSELAVIYASRMDETYKGLFFEKTIDKFQKELRFLKDETLYKIVWACVKSGTIPVSNNSPRWLAIKEIIT